VLVGGVSRVAAGFDDRDGVLGVLDGALGLALDLADTALSYERQDRTDDQQDACHDEEGEPRGQPRRDQTVCRRDHQQDQRQECEDAGRSEQARTDACPLGVSADLGLGQRDLASHDGRDVVGRVGHELAESALRYVVLTGHQPSPPVMCPTTLLSAGCNRAFAQLKPRRWEPWKPAWIEQCGPS